MHEDDREELLSVYRTGRAARSALHRRAPHPLQGRQVVWVNSSVSFIRDSDDRPALAVLMVQDISQRKAAEQALLAQAELNEHQARHDALTGLANRTLFGTASSTPSRPPAATAAWSP